MAEISQDLLDINLTPDDRLALMLMAYGENVGQPEDVIKMTLQSAINRLISPRDKEFGRTIPEILNKGYYAVSNPNYPYREAKSDKFDTKENKKLFNRIGNILDKLIKEKDYGNDVMFYFRPEEAKSLKKKLRKTGEVGPYETFSY